VINKNSSPGDQKKRKKEKRKNYVKRNFALSAFSRRGLFLSRKIRKNILPCVHFPAGAFFWRKKRFLKNCYVKII